MTEDALQGICPDRFAPVREAMADQFAQGQELGARFAFAIDGEVVIDLWGGFMDRQRSRPFTADTLTPVFSTTKAVASILIARLVDEGRLNYDLPVVELWPEFGQAGKERITVAQVLSHQDGLVSLLDPMDPSDWYDWDAVCAKLAAMAPMWPPGTASGYHPTTFGYTAGEIFRRAAGRTMGQVLAEDFEKPFGLQIFIGLPESEDHRVADVERPGAVPNFGEITPIRRAAFLTKWAAPGPRTEAAWRRAEIPSANGHADAPSLARLLGMMACDGMLDGRSVLRPSTIAEASKERIAGPDLVLPYVMSWGAGFMRNSSLAIYGPGRDSFGHSGWGGSCAFADPERRVSGAYVMNRQSPDLLGDPRSRRLIDTAYSCL
jgi:CubicO group peptidase (beta-lactamase class C family)